MISNNGLITIAELDKTVVWKLDSVTELWIYDNLQHVFMLLMHDCTVSISYQDHGRFTLNSQTPKFSGTLFSNKVVSRSDFSPTSWLTIITHHLFCYHWWVLQWTQLYHHSNHTLRGPLTCIRPTSVSSVSAQYCTPIMFLAVLSLQLLEQLHG